MWAWRTNEPDGAVRSGRFARTNPRCCTSPPSSWPAWSRPSSPTSALDQTARTKPSRTGNARTNPTEPLPLMSSSAKAGDRLPASVQQWVPRSSRGMTAMAMDTNEPDARRIMHERTRAVDPPPSRRMTAWAFGTNEPETDDQTSAPPTLDGRLEAGHDEAGVCRAHGSRERTRATQEVHERTRASRPPQHERTRDRPPTPPRHGRPQSRPSSPTPPREQHGFTRTNPSAPQPSSPDLIGGPTARPWSSSTNEPERGSFARRSEHPYVIEIGANRDCQAATAHHQARSDRTGHNSAGRTRGR